MPVNPTIRFSNRVADYIKFRPGYPSEIIPFLEFKYGLLKAHVIADIGSGTGKSTELFLQYGNKVFGVEPNAEMRLAAEEAFNNYGQNFISLDGSAESTKIPDYSIDFIIAAQAFHWFQQAAAKKEFTRILKPEGYIVLIWNERGRLADGFMAAYDQFLMKWSTDYALVDYRNISNRDLSLFFGSQGFVGKEFDYNQVFDFEGLTGRYNSCSYAIPKDDIKYSPAIEALNQIFDLYNIHGKVEMEYSTKLFIGRL